jgi:serine protease AprX
MFSFKNKLDINLRHALDNKLYKNFRVNIHCKSMQGSIEKKLTTYKGNLIRSIPSVGIICAELSAHAIERLIEYPEVDYIAMDSFALLCGSSVLAANGIKHQEQRYKLTGKGVVIGLIDSGVYPHPDLTNPVSRIKSFIDLINCYKYPYDDNGHGTFISGIICGNGYQSKGMYKGVAENSSLHVIKAFNASGRGYVSDILYAVQYLIENREDLNIKILCLPFELLQHDKFILSAFSSLFNEAVNSGIIPIVPSGGNINSEGSMLGIATLSNCITVGGVDTRSSTTSYKYSSAGPCGKVDKPDLASACVDICSLNSNTSYISERNGIKLFAQPLDKPYTTYTGTSCSAAFISGICALLLQNNPDLSFKDVLSLLKASCKLLNISKWQQGSGLIDLNKLLP